MNRKIFQSRIKKVQILKSKNFKIIQVNGDLRNLQKIFDV
jgi:hypothetical protein